jgi:predicted anti-sigma-YlaC factor YlaD
MHRVIRDHLEEVLAESDAGRAGSARVRTNQDCEIHLQECGECRDEIAALRAHAGLLRQLRADAEPRAGFYARVMERIEAQGARSIWSVFSESPFGKRLAVASMALAVLFGLYLVTSEQFIDTSGANRSVQIISDVLPNEDQPSMVLGASGMPNRDAVLVNLVTYREQ